MHTLSQNLAKSVFLCVFNPDLDSVVLCLVLDFLYPFLPSTLFCVCSFSFLQSQLGRISFPPLLSPMCIEKLLPSPQSLQLIILLLLPPCLSHLLSLPLSIFLMLSRPFSLPLSLFSSLSPSLYLPQALALSCSLFSSIFLKLSLSLPLSLSLSFPLSLFLSPSLSLSSSLPPSLYLPQAISFSIHISVFYAQVLSPPPPRCLCRYCPLPHLPFLPHICPFHPLYLSVSPSLSLFLSFSLLVHYLQSVILISKLKIYVYYIILHIFLILYNHYWHHCERQRERERGKVGWREKDEPEEERNGNSVKGTAIYWMQVFVMRLCLVWISVG